MVYIPVTQWVKQEPLFNTPQEELNPSVATDAAGNSYICYQTFGTVSGGTVYTSPDIVIMKMDTTGSVVWVKQNKSFNSDANDSAPVIAVKSDGSKIYVAYSTLGVVSGGTSMAPNFFDLVVFKMDGNGNVGWIKENNIFNSVANDQAPSIALDNDGNPIITYVTQGTVSSGTNFNSPTDIVVMKFNGVTDDGSISWIKQQTIFNTSKSDLAPDISFDAANNIYITYTTNGITSGGSIFNNDTDIVVFKMNSSGTLQWIKQQTTFNTNKSDSDSKITTDAAGNSYIGYVTSGSVSGGSNIGITTTDIIVFKMDNTGALQWVKQYAALNTTLDEAEIDIQVNSVGEVFICYKSNGTVSDGSVTGSGPTVVVAKLSNNGDIEWIKQDMTYNPTYSGSRTINKPRISLDNTSNIYITYNTNGTVPGGTKTGMNDIVIFKIRDLLLTNSFMATVNPYVALNTVQVYKKATVDALVAGAELPAAARVSWAPLGLPAGSLLRDLRRTVPVSYSAMNRLEKYRFQKVQYMLSADTEGVSGGPADEDPWRTGYICTWAADGVPPVF